MHEIKSIPVLPAAKALGALHFVLGEVVGIFFAIAAVVRGNPAAALLDILLFGIIYGVLSFIVFAMACWLYNLIATNIGGVELELAQR